MRSKNVPSWPVTYTDTLPYLDKQGYMVLGNINRTIIEGLDHAKVKFHIIIPDTTLKSNGWISCVLDMAPAKAGTI